MHWDHDHDDQPRDDDDRALISGNLLRIKNLIYGTVDDSPPSRRSGHGTSGRDCDM
jgi:hypothetical protein